MHSQEKFDDIVNKKLNEQEFPFDENNWEKAAAMIDASRKGKNRAAIWFFSTLVVLTCGVLGVYTYTNISEPTDQLAQSKTVAQINAEQLGNSIVLPTVTETTENTSADTNSASNLNGASDNTSNNTNVSENTNTSSNSENTASQKSIVTSPKTNAVNEAIAIKKNSMPTPTSKEGSYATAKTAKSDKSTNSNNPVSTTKTGSNAKAQDVNGSKANSDMASSAKTADPNLTEPSTTDVAAKKPADESNGTETPAEKKGEATKDLETAKTESIAATETIAKPEEAKAIDTAALATEVAKPIVVPKLDKNYVSFEAGADYLLGWKNPSSTDANGFNPIIGINYSHFFNKHIGFSIGAQYNSVGNLNYSNHTSMVTSYTFGQENDVTIITPVKLHYAVMPFKFNYAINTKNIIGIGCNVAYLMTVDNKVDTYNERLNYTSEHSISKTKGYVSGIKNFDTQLSVFYRKTIYKELSLNAELLYGLTDVKDNAFFDHSSFDRNVGFKLTLVLNVFKK